MLHTKFHENRPAGSGVDQLANLHSDTLRDLAPLSYGEV